MKRQSVILDEGTWAAFPNPARARQNMGLTKREYFAAHAPAVPDWYRELAPVKIGQYLETSWPWFWADMVLNGE